MKENSFFDIIKSILPTFEEELAVMPFSDAGIDSIDLVTIRVEFERLLGSRIPDFDWLEFETVSQINNYYLSNNRNILDVTQDSKYSGVEYKLIVNMPQMAIGALSENWLFKEIGGVHWDMICDGLGESSFNLKDDIGNRLYATFVRIRIDFSGNLKSFKESEELNIGGEVKRFGESMYFSEVKLKSKTDSIRADLMTTFSIRNSTDNTKLTKSQPAGKPSSIELYNQLPSFGNEYRLLKKGELDSFSYKALKFVVGNSPIFETEYELNPYYDLNGVDLLYFAAYPIINDTCEAIYFNKEQKLVGRWEQKYYTSYKDIFYFSNCNINETLIYRLIQQQELENGAIQIQSELVRKSDLVVIAKIFSIKSKFK